MTSLKCRDATRGTCLPCLLRNLTALRLSIARFHLSPFLNPRPPPPSVRHHPTLSLPISGITSVVLRRYDFIEILDGAAENADTLGRHCSNIAPAAVISSGPSIQIKFVSDYAHQGAGFSLRYEIFKTGEFC